jgi:hypothetical protein
MHWDVVRTMELNRGRAMSQAKWHEGVVRTDYACERAHPLTDKFCRLSHSRDPCSPAFGDKHVQRHAVQRGRRTC